MSTFQNILQNVSSSVVNTVTNTVQQAKDTGWGDSADHSISRLVSSIGKNGLQDKTRYGATIYGSGFIFVCDPYLIDMQVPGPRYTFYLDNYWRGNPEYKSPSGIRFDEPLIMTFMVPSKGLDAPLNQLGSNLLSFLNRYQTSYFSSQWRTPETPYFAAYDVRDELNIHIRSYNRSSGVSTNQYIFNRCYLEKILPFQFSALEPGYQTMNLSFTVSHSSTLG